ncbi:hypothetical protein [Alicyclobacillus macrosporangiidus]|uniref:Uncharacterized protein n=1 Tax=Alicyclobacillus macrosporangiidus TaxID=392015 RepID=A0A1I7LB89_9BACL|nr:hypothetical protein [Alicyclobacillus macrosporangiidus]SFV07012.1 hypothetical protein SAMN05421543_1336 [Alicyclobacillus macrosporangiidus]
MVPRGNAESYSPLLQPADLHYRHAKGENLLLIGPQSNPHKIPWVRNTVSMFARLGWKFILLDLSERSDLGPSFLCGGKWSTIEYNAISNLQAPITVRVLTFNRLLETLDEVHVLKETTKFPHVVVVHLGDLRDLTDTEKQALQNSLERIDAYRGGVWIIADRFQPLNMSKLPSFYQTQIVLAGTPADDAWKQWVDRHHIEDADVTALEEDEGYFLFRGRSEGAGRLLQVRLRGEDGYSWQTYSI